MNSQKKKYKIAIVGATGAVGREMLAVLEARKFPVLEILPFASTQSAGKKIIFADQTYTCQPLKKGCFQGVDIVFFDASDEVSRLWVPEALSTGALVVDHSAAHRMNPEVALVVPEVNGETIGGHQLIAGPNCTTAQLVMVLKPLHDRFGLKRVLVSTYQSVSGAGTRAIEELKSQVLNPGSAKPEALKHPIAFNLIPHIGGFDSEGHTSEETKVMEETRKILNLPSLKIACTAVRVPTLYGHAEAVVAEFEKPVDLSAAKKVLESFPGVVLQDDPTQNLYPMNLTTSGRDDVYIGRLRRDPSVAHGLMFWIVADNLRKGAALNAVQIAERMIDAT